jgi:hypothetical protein
MRKALGAVLIGVGVFGIVLAILLPTVVVDRSKKTPLNLNITQISSGPAKLLDAATGEIKDVQLRATRIVRTDSQASDGTNTTVNETLCIVVVDGDTPNCVPSTDPRLLSFTSDRVTANRRSAESVHIAKYGENVNGNASIRHIGMSYKWPIDAKKTTYLFFSPDLGKAYPATYKGTSKIKGLTVYEYESATGPQPYKIQGIFDGTYDDTRTVYVEPRTGAIINGVEHQVQTLTDGTVALDTTLKFEQSAIDYQANYANGKIDDLRQAQLWGPLIFGILGVAALVGGFLLLRRGERSGGDRGGEGRHEAPTPDDTANYGAPPDPGAPTYGGDPSAPVPTPGFDEDPSLASNSKT